MTLRHPAMMKGLYWATGSLIAAQLIYCFDESIGWMYAVYYLTNLILTDLFAFDYRPHVLEATVLMSYVIIAGGIISGMITTPLTLNLLLIPAGIYNVWLAYRGFEIFNDQKKWNHISERNMAIVEKKSGFMNIFFGLIGIVSVSGIIMGLIQ